MITIKQLAEKLNVSKPTITRNKPEHLNFEVIDGVNYINEELEKEITKKIMQNKERYNSDTNTETSSDTLVQQLISENKFLKAQIEEKDQLIKEQTKLLDQQQKLNLATMSKIERLEEKEENNSETIPQHEPHHESVRSDTDVKQSFFAKLFKK